MKEANENKTPKRTPKSWLGIKKRTTFSDNMAVPKGGRSWEMGGLQPAQLQIRTLPKKKSDKIVSTWCSWENIHNSERQMLPWDRSRGEESEELPQPQHSGWQSSTWLGSAPRSGCTEQLCTSPSRWQQQYLSARSVLCRDALFLPILCRDALFSYPTSSSLSSCAKPSTLWKFRFNRDSGRWLLYAGLILTDYSGYSREQTWQKSAGISGWCDNHN